MFKKGGSYANLIPPLSSRKAPFSKVRNYVPQEGDSDFCLAIK